MANDIMSDNARKRIVPGAITFEEAADSYYVDKTLFIRDVIERDWQVSVITRPRRFGKSLNMEMLKTFFEKTVEDTSRYFRDKKIWACGEEYRTEQGKYPVIYLNLAGVDDDSWAESYEDIKELIASEFNRHKELLSSKLLTQTDIGRYKKIVNKKANRAEYRSSLNTLSDMLYKHYEKMPIILIDEYDVPIQSGYDKGYYDVRDFMSGFLLKGLKYNPDFKFAVLTGVLPVSGSSLSRSLNSFDYYTALSSRYAEHFGFTRDEVRDMLAYYSAEDKYKEVCEWYDGYMFGDTEVFNPWSVLNCIRDGFAPDVYWANTGNNLDLGKLLEDVSLEAAVKISDLRDGGTVTARIDETVDYSELMKDSENVFTLLLHYGYLIATGENTDYLSMYNCASTVKTTDRYYYLKVPNEEVARVFREEVSGRMIVSENEFDEIWEIIERFDEQEIEDGMQKFIEDSVTHRDAPYEAFYSGFIRCMCKYKKKEYTVIAEGNSGKGIVDIAMKPNNPGKPGIVIELERISDDNPDKLKKAAYAGLKQITDQKYDTVLRVQGVTDIVKIGMAFSGTSVKAAISR
ncbi:MAG: ATP-binding protein [Clostridia bacterium]|nr:ATP-binding protein [Clostridia bacterium]